MSGRTPVGEVAEQLKKAFEDFLQAYKTSAETRTWTDYFSDPGTLLADASAWASGRPEEHALQEKLLEELKAILDLSWKSEGNSLKFFKALVAFKLVERLNLAVFKFLDPTAKSEIAGRNFVPLYHRYSGSVLSITESYEAQTQALLNAINSKITLEDTGKILAPPSDKTGPAYFGILLANLEKTLWIAERQRAFDCDLTEPASPLEPVESYEMVSGSGEAGAGVADGGSTATVVLDILNELIALVGKPAVSNLEV